MFFAGFLEGNGKGMSDQRSFAEMGIVIVPCVCSWFCYMIRLKGLGSSKDVLGVWILQILLVVELSSSYMLSRNGPYVTLHMGTRWCVLLVA